MKKNRKYLSIVTPCFNEEENIHDCYDSIKSLFKKELKDYDYEHIFCDNSSTDRTLQLLKDIALKDKNVKIIANSRNFGASASLFNGIINSSGDATVLLAADLQDPPELIVDFVRKWQEGHKVVYGIRKKRSETFIMYLVRKAYYRLLKRLTSINIPLDAGDFQLIDRKVVEALRNFEDYYPYIRGMIASCGFDSAGIPYKVRKRKKGKAKGGLFTIMDLGLNGLISFSNVPVRICLLFGFLLSGFSIIYAFIQLVLVLINFIAYGRTVTPGIPTLIIALFFFSGVQLFFLGVIGEYVSAVHYQVRKRPLIIEKERINF